MKENMEKSFKRIEKAIGWAKNMAKNGIDISDKDEITKAVKDYFESEKRDLKEFIDFIHSDYLSLDTAVMRKAKEIFGDKLIK